MRGRWRGLRWLPRVAVVITGLLAAAVVTLVAWKTTNWSSQTCLLCKSNVSAESWLCYFALGVSGAAVVVSVVLLVLPISPQLQCIIAWAMTGLWATLGGMLTKYSLPAYSDGSSVGAYILSVYCLGWAAVLMWVLLAVERCCVPQTDDRLGKLTKLQSMKSYDLECQLDGMKRTPRGEAWWSVALKAPLDPRVGLTGSEVQYRDADADPARPGWTCAPGVNIQTWLHSHLARDTRGKEAWSGWALYSDEPPAPGSAATASVIRGPDPGRTGACKGVVLWNKTTMGWLVHSVPRWPPAEGFLAGGALPALPMEHERGAMGQSFVFVSLPLSKLREVNTQLNLMGAFIYHAHQDGIYSFVSGAPPPVMLNRMVLGGGLYHVGKRGDWKGDIYGDGLAEKTVFGLCGGPVHVQSWREGGDALAPNIDADNIEQTRWANGAPISTYQDNGTWAVSAASAKHRWSFVGDLARVERHILQGGGGIVIRDPALWKTFLEMIEQWDGCFGK